MKITTQPKSETEVAHTFYDSAELDERTPEATTAEVRFNPLGINVDLIRRRGGTPIGGVFIETYRGKLRVLAWRDSDLGNDPHAIVNVYDFLEETE